MRAHALQASLHTDICMPYLRHYGTEEQKQRWLPGPRSPARCLLAIAMTEPGDRLRSRERADPGDPRTATTT